jgi:hypothetical protein
MGKRSEILDIALDTLHEAGIEIVAVEITAKGHHRLRFHINGTERTVIVGSNRSCWRAPYNARADVRRILRGGG